MLIRIGKKPKIMDVYAAYPVKIAGREITFYVSIEESGEIVTEITKNVLAKNLAKCFEIAINAMISTSGKRIENETEERPEAKADHLPPL